MVESFACAGIELKWITASYSLSLITEAAAEHHENCFIDGRARATYSKIR